MREKKETGWYNSPTAKRTPTLRSGFFFASILERILAAAAAEIASHVTLTVAIATFLLSISGVFSCALTNGAKDIADASAFLALSHFHSSFM